MFQHFASQGSFPNFTQVELLNWVDDGEVCVVASDNVYQGGSNGGIERGIPNTPVKIIDPCVLWMATGCQIWADSCRRN